MRNKNGDGERGRSREEVRKEKVGRKVVMTMMVVKHGDFFPCQKLKTKTELIFSFSF